MTADPARERRATLRREDEPPPPVRVLLIEDDELEARLVEQQLSALPGFTMELTVARTRPEAMAGLDSDFDVCLLDYHLGGYTGIELISGIDLEHLSGPVIMLTMSVGADIDDLALRNGLADFLNKNDVSTAGLGRSIRYARRAFSDRRRLQFAAEHDGLTGLPNRSTFMARLQQMLADGDVAPSDLHVLYIDLDGFKTVNDTWGHDVGDRVLQHAASQLKSSLPDDALVARHGGDELVAAVTPRGSDAIDTIAERVLTAIRQPLPVREGHIVTTASIGVASCIGSNGDAEEVVRLADHAMFRAKNAGRDIAQTHVDANTVRAQQGSLEADLHHALANNGLHLVFQPQFDLQTGHLAGVEALSRWEHPVMGAVKPGKFVPVATACGLIRPLTFWSLRSAMSALSHIAEHVATGFRMAVNVDPAQLMNPKFAERVQEMLDQSSVPPELIRFEITEEFFGSDVGIPALTRLVDLGISVALDDFGTGYSCLAQLARLPIDTLKIDLSFIHKMTQDARAAGLVRTVLTLGEEMGMTVIAEGVETAEQEALLEELGCRVVQGFHYSRGVARGEFLTRIEDGDWSIAARTSPTAG